MCTSDLTEVAGEGAERTQTGQRGRESVREHPRVQARELRPEGEKEEAWKGARLARGEQGRL